MKKDLKKISSLIHNNPSYKDIEDRLDFNGLQIESRPKQFKKRLVLTPIIASAVALVLTFAIIPTFIYLSRSNQNV